MLTSKQIRTTKIKPRVKRKPLVKIVECYDTTADARMRVSLRGADTKHYQVKALSNGAYLIEPRRTVPTQTEPIPSRVLKMIETSAANFKKGKVSAPIDLSEFLESQD